jgi:GH24 family phage-related lysozyme (muramidase)
VENRFLEAEMEFKGILVRSGRTSAPRAVATSFATGLRDPIRDPMNDPKAPWRYRDKPPEGFVRVHVNAEDFVDLPADDANAMYIDNNIVNFAIQPRPVTLEIDSQPLTLYYQSGAELRLQSLSTITDDYNDGTYLTYIAGTQLVRCDRNFQPMYNAFTTPRLHWLKVALHDKVRELAAQQLGMAEIVYAFAHILKEYSQLEGTASWKGISTEQSALPVDGRCRSGAGNAAMTVSAAGVEFVKGWEGFVPKLYNDPVGHCTVGYGTLVHKGNCDGRDSEQRYLNGVSKEEATRLLAAELAEKQKAMREAVKVPLNQNQYDALVSFAYNVGAGAFRRSTLLKLLNQGKYDDVPRELKKWSKARQDGKLIDLPGLVNRRAAEATLFQTPAAAAAQSLRGLPWGALGRTLSQNGVVVPARHSYRYESPSLASTQSNLSVQQNPIALVAGIEVADAIQIGLAAAGIVQSQVNGTPGAGLFHLFYDKAQRMLTPEARAQMPGAAKAKQRYSHQLFFISMDRPLVTDAYANVIIEWGGNIYGEIETAEIRKDQRHSTDWQHSSNDLTITNVARIPAPNTDPRTWPLTYTYEGTFDPAGNGYFEYSGEFEINAFGGLKFNRHEVVSRSLIDWMLTSKPEEFVQKGKDVVVRVPDIPKEQLDYLRAKLP